MLKRIHVNMHVVRRNQREGRRDPPLSVKARKRTFPATSVDIRGPAKLIYSPDDPLSCGARVWIETRATVVLDADGSAVELV